MEFPLLDLHGIVLLHQVDWDSALRNDDGIVNELGFMIWTGKLCRLELLIKNLLPNGGILLKRKVTDLCFTIGKRNKFICITFLKSNMGNDEQDSLFPIFLIAIHSLK